MRSGTLPVRPQSRQRALDHLPLAGVGELRSRRLERQPARVVDLVVVVVRAALDELAEVEVHGLLDAAAVPAVPVAHIAEPLADRHRDAGLLAYLARRRLLTRLAGVGAALRQPGHARVARGDDEHLGAARLVVDTDGDAAVRHLADERPAIAVPASGRALSRHSPAAPA